MILDVLEGVLGGFAVAAVWALRLGRRGDDEERSAAEGHGASVAHGRKTARVSNPRTRRKLRRAVSGSVITA